MTAEEADLFLPIAPGTDTALFCGLLVHLAEHGALDDAYIEAHTTGFAADARAGARDRARRRRDRAPRAASPQADSPAFFDLFHASARAVTCFSQGVNQSAQGTDKVNAIINCHLATGRIGRPGMGPFSLTGQPNAMGGPRGRRARQSAGRPYGLRARRDRPRAPLLERAPHGDPRRPQGGADVRGDRARRDQGAVGHGDQSGGVAAARGRHARRRSSKLELFVVSENVLSNDTVNAGAHVLLPAAAWGEKDGTVTNSERRISRQRAFLPPPGEAKPDWWIVSRGGAAHGLCARPSRIGSAADVFREHAALSGFENAGRARFRSRRPRRDFGRTTTTRSSRCNGRCARANRSARRAKSASSPTGGFFTPDRKARFVAPRAACAAGSDLRRLPVPAQYRPGSRPVAHHDAHRPKPAAGGPSAGALRRGPSAGRRPHGPRRRRLCRGLDPRTAPASSRSWSATTSGRARCSCRSTGAPRPRPAPASAIWSRAHTDPYSGQPEAKATPAAIAPVDFALRGFARARRPLTLPAGTWWARVAVADGTGYLLATNQGPLVWHDFAYRSLASRCAAGRIARWPRGLPRGGRSWTASSTAASASAPADAAPPQWDLARPGGGSDRRGRRTPIPKPASRRLYRGDASRWFAPASGSGSMRCARRVAGGGATSVEDIGRTLRAGTNCGSCLPELKRIIVDERIAHPV